MRRSRSQRAPLPSTTTHEEDLIESRTTFTPSVPLPAPTRKKMIDALQGILADTLALRMMTKQAHWTLRGPWFIARHELFDDIAAHLSDLSDDVAERIAMLGGYPKGGPSDVSKGKRLQDYPEVVKGEQHLQQLVMRLERYVDLLHEVNAVCGRLGDVGTEDLIGGAVGMMEKDLWFLRSHLPPQLTEAVALDGLEPSASGATVQSASAAAKSVGKRAMAEA